MQLHLDSDEVHWVRHALITAAAATQGTPQAIYLHVISKLSEPEGTSYLGEPSPSPDRDRSQNRIGNDFLLG